MSTFEAGQRIKVNENYAKYLNIPAGDIEETGALGTVKSFPDPYVEVTLDTTEELEGDYLFFPNELDLVS